MTETWVEDAGFCPSDSDWNEWEEIEFPVGVAFKPYDGLWPLHAECHKMVDGYAVLDVPKADMEDKNFKSSNMWFPVKDECWIIVPKIFVRPQ